MCMVDGEWSSSGGKLSLPHARDECEACVAVAVAIAVRQQRGGVLCIITSQCATQAPQPHFDSRDVLT